MSRLLTAKRHAQRGLDTGDASATLLLAEKRPSEALISIAFETAMLRIVYTPCIVSSWQFLTAFLIK